MTVQDDARGSHQPKGRIDHGSRWFKNVSLRWKLGLVVMLALATALTFVRNSFLGTIAKADDTLTANTRDMTQERTRADLAVKAKLYQDLRDDIRESVTALTRQREFFDTLHTSPGQVGQRAMKWLGNRIENLSFLCVFDEDRRLVGGFACLLDGEGKRSFVDLGTRAGSVLPDLRLFKTIQSRDEVTGSMVLPPELLEPLGLAESAQVPVRAMNSSHAPDFKVERRALAVGSTARIRVVDKLYFAFGAQLFNRRYGFVDDLKEVLYGWEDDEQSRRNRRLQTAGCATIFLYNLRVCTNVVGKSGKRSLGTLLSDEVYGTVLRKGKTWSASATVADSGIEMATAYQPIRDVFGDIVGALSIGMPYEHYNEGQTKAMAHLRRYSFRNFLMALLLGTLVALVVGVVAASFIARPLVALETCTREVGDGHLRVEVTVDGTDEVGKLADGFRAMLERLVDLTRQVKSAASQIGEATNTIEGTLHDHASTTSQQSAAVSETTATLEELAASSREIAENAMEVVRMASKTLESTRRGVEIGNETIAKMDEIHQVNEDDIERIRALSNKLRRIDEIMALINTIADQTKLIAFNAAIEAAAAGDAGRRFSVVSAEIRRLAESVREQADEIRNQVGDIQKAASELVVSREAGTKKVESGVAATRRVNASLQEICDDSERVLSNSKKISIATQQQRSATEQTLRAVREINDGVNQLATGAQQTGEVMKRLADLSDNLSTNVDRFEV